MAKTKKENLYGETLNLPKTDFPMRGNLPKNEPSYLEYWDDINLYDLVQKQNEGNETFILHDGPPYANGNIHLGHTLNKVLKDIIIKSKTQQGINAPYVPGWDTHGLPIELKAIEQQGLDMQADPVAFRDACAAYALSFVDLQREQFKRLGVRGDWDNPYLTLKPEFEAEELGIFGEMAQKGYIYKGLKPVHWCPHDKTALAEAEIEYGEETSPSIFVKFALKDGKGRIEETDTSFVIWTTTPWTLPANQAVAVHPDFEYVIVNINDERYIIAKERVDAFLEEAGLADYEFSIEESFKGSELEYVEAQHPFLDRKSLVILGNHVTLDAGTGCVHTAPGHGQDDYIVGKKYNLETLSPIDDDGNMTEEAGPYAGLSTKEANKEICKYLEETKALIKLKYIKHQYPHCWRCGTPTLFRSTAQWFASIDGFREEALSAISNDVKFTPEWGEERIYNMIRDRGDWCISRQRLWGVPIPVFYCDDCHEIIMGKETIAHVQDIVREHGTNCWFALTEEELLPEGYTCPKCGGKHFTKEKDIMDVWFDSGSSHQGVLKVRSDLQWPADLYLEGSDQHRGWFNSSLCTSVATEGKAPYKGLLTHGFVVDEHGRKMSKSLGNGVDPLEVIEKQGADILRLWVSSTDYRSDVSISQDILKQISEAYRKIRNTFRYMLGSISDFKPETDRIAFEELEELDQWAMLKLVDMIQIITEAYAEYNFNVVYRSFHNFCNIDLSSFYFDIIKDRLYSESQDDKARRSVQTVLYDICLALDQLIAPILAFTSEEVFHYIPMENKAKSVQLSGWPTFPEVVLDDNFRQKWATLIDLRNEVLKPLEIARRDKVIGNGLDAKLTLYLEDNYMDLMKHANIELESFFIVSKVECKPVSEAPEAAWKSEEIENLFVEISQAPGEKCPRCWKYTEDIGENAEYPDVCARCASVLAK